MLAFARYNNIDAVLITSNFVLKKASQQIDICRFQIISTTTGGYNQKKTEDVAFTEVI